MPELPEVETTRRALHSYLLGDCLNHVEVRQRSLRWPVSAELEQALQAKILKDVRRRGKYLLLDFNAGHLIIHLGMSGSLRVIQGQVPKAGVHDHIDFSFRGEKTLRFTDPRRFGAVLYQRARPETHSLLNRLGPEPLGESFDAEYLYRLTRSRRAPIKALLMDSRVVVGVGNIYANEALYHAGIRPSRRAGRLSRAACAGLVDAIRRVLREAIDAGGTTLRDFAAGEGRPGYFQLSLAVYGRAGQPCSHCGSTLKSARIAQRGTVYCPHCQR